jgi:hypothetical protein
MPQLTIHGDVEQLTQQEGTVTVKCPGAGDSITTTPTTREVNLPVGAACAS